MIIKYNNNYSNNNTNDMHNTDFLNNKKDSFVRKI
jgi:hypothetical protein